MATFNPATSFFNMAMLGLLSLLIAMATIGQQACYFKTRNKSYRVTNAGKRKTKSRSKFIKGDRREKFNRQELILASPIQTTLF